MTHFEFLAPLATRSLQPQSLCMAIADKLRERILTHRMPPGSDVNDGALAQEFGVSRTPVREAMKLLCHEGLLTAQVRRGMTVTQLTAAQEAEARQLCHLLQQRLQAPAGAQPGQADLPGNCLELTHILYGMARARLQLARGPDGCEAEPRRRQTGGVPH